MKLDSIIYDKESLANTLIQQWTTNSPLFSSIYPSDTTNALVNVFASYGAMLQYMLVSAMANCYTETAFSDRGIYQLAVTLGNVIRGNNSALTRVDIEKNNLIGVSTTIPSGTKFKINNKSFFNPYGILFPAGVSKVSNITLLQGEKIELTKVTSGMPYERFYFSSDFKCNHNYVTVKVNGENWSVSDSFLDYDKSYISTNEALNVVVLKTDADGRSYIKFGDNQLGNLPAVGSSVQISYVSNDGEQGNINETNVEGKLDTELVYLDGNNNQQALSVEIKTTTTAYGGSGTQSIETLRHTSPYVFASGHRAIRRQDYNAILQSQCGYLTTNTWGEYEEANDAGAYDSIMMNMVYYTGLKSFVNYPFTTVGEITNLAEYQGTIGSTKGFYGSHMVKIVNKKDEGDYVTLQDTGAKGFLFINDNNIDKRDSILPIWNITSSETNNTAYEYSLATNDYIRDPGSLYQVNDRLSILNNNIDTGLTLRVAEVDENGGVVRLEIQKKYMNVLMTNMSPSNLSERFTTKYLSKEGTGSGLVVSLNYVGEYKSDFIRTINDGAEGESQEYPISNAMSSKPDADFYQSLKKPSLLNPVQILLDYTNVGGKGIAGIKFKSAKASSSAPFIGKFAMYGTLEENIDEKFGYENIRNNNKWTRIIDVTEISDPYAEEDITWTDWIPTNCMINSEEFMRYKKFMIEIYSTDSSSTAVANGVSFSKMKILHEEDASFIYYNENGKLNIKFPIAGSPGPDGDGEVYLTKDLLDSNKYSLYDYDIKLDGITSTNGYKNGNILAYNLTSNGIKLGFTTEVIDIENQVFKTCLNGSTVLTGNVLAEMKQNGSLDEELVYNCELDPISNTIPYKSDYLYKYEQSQNGRDVIHIDKATPEIGMFVYDDKGNIKGVVGSVDGSTMVVEMYPVGSGSVVYSTTSIHLYPLTLETDDGTTTVYVESTPNAGSPIFNLNYEPIGYIASIDDSELPGSITSGSDENEPQGPTYTDPESTTGKLTPIRTLSVSLSSLGSHTIDYNGRTFPVEVTELSTLKYSIFFNQSDETKSGFTLENIENVKYICLKGKFFNIYVTNETPVEGDIAYDFDYLPIGKISKVIPATGNSPLNLSVLYDDGSLENNFINTNYKTEGNRRGFGYKLGDLIEINGSGGQLKLEVAKVDERSGVEILDWKSTRAIHNKNIDLNGICETTTNGNGKGLKVNLIEIPMSGANGITGNGATIRITSNNNLASLVSFKGNRIDSQDVNYLDQPIIDKYNHFTTYMEFKQPEVYQIDIMVKVSLSTSAAITSSMIMQQINNNVNEVFALKPTSMGKGLKISDIYTAVMKTPNVDWCKVIKPTDNITIPRNSTMVLANLTIKEITE